ncbi:gamma-glutamyltransferase [Massilia sp. TS11]|uniref:gamma-glutamyltransferase n=1 Tax=Massilia sp. TS11 TaxID=2908003 RepID=UPI001EDA5F78|nr:gamma-glutamyltransferase [Massilia sp. TS11]MCG2585541.1 gamma-glutamyltransferase [Massilia sp. TS11]
MIRLTSLSRALFLLGLLSAAPLLAQEAPQRAPEIATGFQEKQAAVAHKYMAAAANPLAAAAGYEMLKQGGTAVDAAVAIQMVLTLVEPQSSGIGGGAFIMFYDGKKVRSYDGRETAPASATEKLFQLPDGRPMSREQGIVGGRSVGAPGAVRVLELAHKAHGKLPWKTLFEPAIRLAENGFAVSPRLNALLNWDKHIRKDPVAGPYFYDEQGNARPVGYLLKNPALAKTLREIAEGGADAFYKGHIAKDIAARVQGHPSNPGGLTVADIEGYQPKVREPICTDYRVWQVCGMPPPSSGGLIIGEMLGMFAIKDLRPYPPQKGELQPEAVHLFSEVGRLAYADRDRYLADPDFVPLPGKGVASLLHPAYLAKRAALIGERSMGRAAPGKPDDLNVAWGTDNAIENPSTSHVVAVDAYGGALSMTTTIEDAFGARMMVDGFILNNQLTDFSFASQDEYGPVANRVQAGKRPRSAMSPTLVFDKRTGELVLATGSPGGTAIVNYVAKVLVGTLDWGLDVQQAISLPNFGSRNGPTELEAKRAPQSLIDALQAKGHQVRVIEQTSGLQGIMRATVNGQKVWLGGADPRREGVARGD